MPDVILTEEQVDEIEEAIRVGLFVFSRNDNGSDYFCAYCGEYAQPVKGPHTTYNCIDHQKNCLGERTLKMLILAKG